MTDDIETPTPDEYCDAVERLETANAARVLLGLPRVRLISLKGFKFNAPLPRYRVLSICICAVLLGFHAPIVKHMVDRNRELDELAAMQRVMEATA